jgi:hypothetical protein
MDFQDIRQARAEAAYQAYWFHGATVESANGWECTTPGKEMTRKVFFYFDDEAFESEEDCTRTANFTVVFESDTSPVVAEAYALVSDTGAELGSMPEKALEDRLNDKMAQLAATMLAAQIPNGAQAGTVDFLRRMRRSGRGPAA